MWIHHGLACHRPAVHAHIVARPFALYGLGMPNVKGSLECIMDGDIVVPAWHTQQMTCSDRKPISKNCHVSSAQRRIFVEPGCYSSILRLFEIFVFHLGAKSCCSLMLSMNSFFTAGSERNAPFNTVVWVNELCAMIPRFSQQPWVAWM